MRIRWLSLVVGLPGLEPGTSSLSEIDSQALCYPASPLVVLLHRSYKDGVNRCPASTSYAFEVRSSQTPVELMPPAAIRAPGCSYSGIWHQKL